MNFRIPCVWEVYGFYESNKDTIEEAIQDAYDGDLPDNGEYVTDSFMVDTEALKDDHPDWDKDAWVKSQMTWD